MIVGAKMDDEKPPSNKTNTDIEESLCTKAGLDTNAGIIFAYHFVVRRFKECWQLWVGEWRFCPTLNSIHRGRNFVLMDIQK